MAGQTITTQTGLSNTSQPAGKTPRLNDAIQWLSLLAGLVVLLLVALAGVVALLFWGVNAQFGKAGVNFAAFVILFVVLWLLISWQQGRAFEKGATLARDVHSNTVQGYISIQQSDDASEMKKAYVQSLPRIMEVMATSQRDVHNQAGEIARHARFLMEQDSKGKGLEPPAFLMPPSADDDEEDEDVIL